MIRGVTRSDINQYFKGRVVYVTTHGTLYHSASDCRTERGKVLDKVILRLAKEPGIPFQRVQNTNAQGEKYTPCTCAYEVYKMKRDYKEHSK